MKFDFNTYVHNLKKEKLEQQDRRKKLNSKKLRSFILIVCEGTKTEPNYFESFKAKLPKGTVDKIVIRGTGRNTTSLLDRAKEYDLHRKRSRLPDYDKVWIVFDRDSFTKREVNQTCQGIIDNGYYSAFSNEAFELWYILHFQYLDSQSTRKDYLAILGKIFKKLGLSKYKKNSTDIYNILETHGNQKSAIENAKKLRQVFKSESPADQKPSTKVDLLVKELNIYIET